MKEKSLVDRIARARQLLAEIHHVPIATVNEDGTPHNSPVFMAFDADLRGFWASHPESQHSQNIARDGRVFLVIFDSREGHGGLYIAAQAKELTQTDEIEDGYNRLKAAKGTLYGEMGELALYATGEQRIYRADPLTFWVNSSQRNEAGTIIRDNRIEITLEQLQASVQ